MAEVRNRTSSVLGAIVQDLIIDGLPPCAISEAHGTYSIRAQLGIAEATALSAAALSHDELCQGAQHVLGLSGIGSRIERERDAIGVYAAPLRMPSGDSTMVLEGREVLWAVAHASPPTIRALISAAQTAMGIRA